MFSPPWAHLARLTLSPLSVTHTYCTYTHRTIAGTRGKGEDHLKLFTLYSPLKDADLYRGWPALHPTHLPFNMPPSYGAAADAPQRASGGERERQGVCLTLRQWLSTHPIHHCLPLVTSFRCYSTTELQTPEAVITMVDLCQTFLCKDLVLGGFWWIKRGRGSYFGFAKEDKERSVWRFIDALHVLICVVCALLRLILSSKYMEAFTLNSY